MNKKRVDSCNTSYIFSNKKAQVTIFIILGIIILLAISLLLLFQTEIFRFKTEEIIPTEKGKIENYLTTCIEQIGEEALFKIGLQGGYIDIPSDIAHDASQNLRLSPNLVVPYWAYGQQTRIPSLQDIKTRIDNYMKQNLRSCLLDLQPFQESYDIIEKSEIEPNTEITAAKVILNVRWDIELKNKAGETIAEVIDHQAESDIKLKQVHELAALIIDREMATLKFEDITQDLLALEHPDVPTAGMELSCTKKTWDIFQVQSSLKKLIHTNIPQIQLKGTNIIEYPKTLPYYKSHYLWDIGENGNNNKINVYFNYEENYPFTFAVTPLSGTKLQSSMLGGTDQISFLCLQNWKFTYDLSYPVLARIRDETTGYNFNLAFTVHIIKNNPNRNEIFSRPSLAIETIDSEEFCANKRIPMTVKTYELIENDLGVFNREEISGVNISYTCLRYKCDLGQTSFNPYTASSKITTNFPYCVGGILRGVKQDYKESWQRVITESNKETELNLIPVYHLPASKLKIVKHNYESEQNIGPPKELSKTETALIKLRIFKSNTTQPFHEATLLYSPTDKELQEFQTLSLLAKADYTYELEINAFDQEKFIGGYKGKWTLPWSDLSQANQITFHIASTDSSDENVVYGLMLSLPQISTSLPDPEIK
ncbi:hypothetical protein HYX11_04305 [Candidatus Woesearchaeota archaeon]|nr:hypothetical protein [Candidatus Woesearchaeota archaeon]